MAAQPSPIDSLTAIDRARLLAIYRRLLAGDKRCVVYLNEATDRQYQLLEWLAIFEPVAHPLHQEACIAAEAHVDN